MAVSGYSYRMEFMWTSRRDADDLGNNMNTRSLLILPPLDLPTHPYPAVPQLVSWLRERGHAVDGADLNIRFFRWALRKEKIQQGRAILHRLQSPGKALSRPEAIHLKLLEKCAGILDRYGVEAEQLLDYRKNETLGSGLLAIESALNFAFAPTFPERLFTVVSLQYEGHGNMYSSESLLRSITEKKSLFDDYFAEVIPGLDLGRYAFIGLSVPFIKQIEPTLRLCAAIRRLHPSLPVYIGGAAVGVHIRTAKNSNLFDLFDGMVVGDGEEPLEKLMLSYAKGTIDLKEIPGLIWRKNGSIVVNPPSSPTPLRDIPTPHTELFDRKDYLCWPGEPLYRLSLSRGCTWGRCSFCNVNGSGIFPSQRIGPEEAFAKVKALLDKGERGIALSDDEADPEVAAGIARRSIEEGLAFNWSLQSRLHPKMTMEWAALLKRSGCRRLYTGIESFNDRILRLMNKALNRDLIEKVLSELAWGGLPVTAYMIIGYPGETEEEARASFAALMEHLENGRISSAYYNLFVIEPFSPIAREPERFGIHNMIRSKNDDLNPIVLGFEAEGISRRRAMELQDEFQNFMDMHAAKMPRHLA